MSGHDGTYMLKVPTDESGRLEIITLRPPLWEYLLFGNRLYAGRKARDAQYRDFQLGYTMAVGPVVKLEQLGRVLSDRFSHASAVVSNLGRILSKPAQEQAFGLPGEPGNVELIEHMALRLTGLYGQLLDWASETRALRVPEEGERLKELAVQFVSQPIRSSYEFVDEFIASLERVTALLADGDQGEHHIELHLTYEVDDRLPEEFERQLNVLVRRFQGH